MNNQQVKSSFALSLNGYSLSVDFLQVSIKVVSQRKTLQQIRQGTAPPLTALSVLQFSRRAFPSFCPILCIPKCLYNHTKSAPVSIIGHLETKLVIALKVSDSARRFLPPEVQETGRLDVDLDLRQFGAIQLCTQQPSLRQIAHPPISPTKSQSISTGESKVRIK